MTNVGLHQNIQDLDYSSYFVGLNPKIVLRSWPNDNLYTVYDYKSDHLYEVDLETYELLCYCTGEILVGDIYKVYDNQVQLVYEYINQLVNEEILFLGENPNPIEDIQRDNKVYIPFLRNVCWLISNRCNLACHHCYIMVQNCMSSELDFTQIIDVMDQFIDANVLSVYLTGGEFFVRKDKLNILSEFENRKICIRGINTNGLLIDDSLIEHMIKLSVKPHINISLDGISYHDEFRNYAGAYEKVKIIINNLIDNGFIVNINSSITRQAIDEIILLYDVLKELGIRAWRLNVPYLMGRWENNHKDNQLTVMEEMNLYKKIFNLWISDYKPFAISLGNVFRTNMCSVDEGDNEEPEVTSPDSYVCAYYRDDCVILPNGDVVGCNGLCELPDLIAGNVLNSSIAEVWGSSVMRSFKDMKISDLTKRPQNKRCVNCDFIKECGLGCRITALTETNDMYKYDPRMCEATQTSYLWFSERV